MLKQPMFVTLTMVSYDVNAYPGSEAPPTPPMDGDFLRVRAAFEKLAEGIHADLMSNEQTRGKILEQFFAGYDAIAESDEGRTFTAFYKFLSSDLATREIEELVVALESRAFWQTLQPQKRDTITDVRTHLNARARQTQK